MLADMLAPETDWRTVAILVAQLLTLAYLVYAFRRVARNQVELAEYLLHDPADWSSESLLAAIETGKNLSIRLSDPIPVHILYFTAWVDETGTVHFRDDVYGHDDALARALGEPASGAH